MYKKYRRNIFRIFFSSSLAQLISVMGTIILGRIFLPGDFAQYGIYASLIAIILTFGTARLDIALIQFDELEEWQDLICTSFYCLLIVSLITHLLLLVLPIELLTPLLINYVAIGIVVAGLSKNYSNLLMSQQKYIAVGVMRILEAFLFVLISIVVKSVANVPYILIVSMISSQLIVVVFSMIISNLKISLISIPKALLVIKRNKEYVLLDSLSSMLNTLSRQLPTLFLPFFLSLESAGLYFFAHRLVAMPTALVSNSIGNVFRKTATLEFKNTGSVKRIFGYTLLWQLGLAFVGAIIFYTFITEDHILYLFGSNWLGVHEVLNLLIIGFAAKFMVSPLTFVFYIVKRLDVNLIGQSLFLLLISGSLVLCYIFDLNLVETTVALVTCQVTVYLMYFFLTIKFLK